MSNAHTTQKQPQQMRHSYIPAKTDIFFTWKVRIPIALLELPDQLCGMAHRVGFTSRASGKQPLYRLKLRKHFADRKTATIPGFFLLENGAFVEYVPPKDGE